MDYETKASPPNDEYLEAHQLWCQELQAAHDEFEDFHARGDKVV